MPAMAMTIIAAIIVATGTTMALEDFAVRALLAGAGVALVAGPLGCVVVWRRMAYFGDTLSHAALLGVALGLLAGIDVTVGVIATSVAVGLLLLAMQSERRLASDTLLGILSHAALAVGLIAVGFLDKVRVDLMAYLFGDILAVSGKDLAWIYGGAGLVLVALAAIWRPLIALTVDEDTAVAEGVSPRPVKLVFTLLIAGTVALAMKAVGVLLVTALLIIPAATARGFARSPEAMAFGAACAGLAAVGGGIAASFAWDAPSGPAVVAAAALLFALTLGLRAAGRLGGALRRR
jgi:zinc transport system permease protein